MEPVECLPKPGGMLKAVSDVVQRQKSAVSQHQVKQTHRFARRIDVEPSHGCARWINRSVRVMWIPNHSMEVRPVTWLFRLSQCIVSMQI